MRGSILSAVLLLAVIAGCSADDWWEHMILYQIYPRSFKDSNGDGIGDINGIRSNLNHLTNIGVTATWLSPVFPSPMKDFGYDISDYYNIAEEFGTIEDLEKLIAEAKEKDIKILLDFVPNHTSDQCEWFKKSVMREPGYENFYVWHDGRDGGKSPPSNWVSVFRGPAWTYHPVRKQWYLHQFLKEQPDLNYRDPNVVREMNNVLKFWLAKGIDGFRVDAIPHLVEADVNDKGEYPDEPISGNTDDEDSYDFLNHIYTRERDLTYEIVYQWRATLDEVTASTNSSTRVLLMEAMSDVDLVMKYYGNATHEGAHFPFNFNLAFLDVRAKAHTLVSNIAGWFNALPKGRVTNWVVGNHDQPRTASRYGTERSDGIIMMGMLLPGVAVTYNGEEIAMTNFYLSWEETVDPSGCNAGIEAFNSTSRDPARTPFQWDDSEHAGFSNTVNKTWLPVSDNYKELNLKLQRATKRSAYNLYVALSALRQNEAFTNGDLQVKAINEDIVIFTRGVEGKDRAVVVVNTDSKVYDRINLQSQLGGIKDSLTVRVASVKSPKEIGDVFDSRSITIHPYEAVAFT